MTEDGHLLIGFIILGTKEFKMKSVRKWVDRVSLGIFAVSSLFIYATVDRFPETQMIENSGEAFVTLMLNVLF